jgi:hypothetical protein
MELISGNIFIRAGAMKKDQLILGHKHNFDHTTYVKKGAIEISLLTQTDVDVAGLPLTANVEFSRVIRASDEINWCLILKGRSHVLKALEDDTEYHCIYAHQAPQAITLENQGQFADAPLSKRDPEGNLWVRVNEKIVQTTSEWAESYR